MIVDLYTKLKNHKDVSNVRHTKRGLRFTLDKRNFAVEKYKYGEAIILKDTTYGNMWSVVLQKPTVGKIIKKARE